MSYQSDNASVCSVDTNGNLTAVSAGVANVTATDTGNNLSVTDQITVVDKAQSAALNAVANAGTRQIAKPSPSAKK